jgi:hypothetical protein
MKDLDGARGDAHLDLGANERMRNRIEKVVDLGVIIGDEQGLALD